VSYSIEELEHQADVALVEANDARDVSERRWKAYRRAIVKLIAHLPETDFVRLFQYGYSFPEAEAKVGAWMQRLGINERLQRPVWQGGWMMDTSKTPTHYAYPTVTVGLMPTDDVAPIAHSIATCFAQYPTENRPPHWVVQVLEDSCSKYGVYRIQFTDAATASVVRYVYNRPEVLKEGTLVEALRYIQQRHPVERAERDRYGRDDD
jgi:hypothetical protein